MKKKLLFVSIFIIILNIFGYTSDYYEPQLFSYYENIINKIKEKNKSFETDPFIQRTIEKKRTIAVYTGNIKKIENEELALFKMWQNNIFNHNKSYLYKNKIEVIENDKKYWIIIKKNLEKHLIKDKEMKINYYFFGGINDKPLFVCFTLEN